jgi:hypothetical protein
MATAQAQLLAQTALYSKALDALMTPQSGREGLNSFLAREWLSSLHAKFNESCERLSQCLISPGRETSKLVVTDAYHLEIINRLAVYHKVDFSRRNVLLVADSAQSLGSIPEGSFVVLFNISTHLVDDEVLARFPHLAYCEAFYKSGDKKVAMGTTDADSAIQIMSSYEVDPSRSINDFFTEHVAPEFNRLYLG